MFHLSPLPYVTVTVTRYFRVTVCNVYTVNDPGVLKKKFRKQFCRKIALSVYSSGRQFRATCDASTVGRLPCETMNDRFLKHVEVSIPIMFLSRGLHANKTAVVSWGKTLCSTSAKYK